LFPFFFFNSLFPSFFFLYSVLIFFPSTVSSLFFLSVSSLFFFSSFFYNHARAFIWVLMYFLSRLIYLSYLFNFS
jgi:hypothetical protein